MHPTLKGSLRSLTIWVASIIGVASEVLPALTPDLLSTLGFDGSTVKKMGAGIAVIMIVCRAVTKKSLTEKGLSPEKPADEHATADPPPTDTH